MDTLLREWIFPKALNSGCFGQNAVLEDFEIDKTVDSKGDQFASEVIFTRLDIKLPDACIKRFHLFIKVQLQNEAFRNLVNSSMQFQNEILMYETILPLLDQNDLIAELFCKYYCGYVDSNDPTKDFIILEDLRNQGYKLPKEKVLLDYEHCEASLRQLGKFHALSYLQKGKKFTQLLSVADKILDKWTPESLKMCQNMIESCAKRGIQPVIDQGESVEILQSLLHEYEDLPTFFNKLVAPTEPDAVICHGDFNRNNLLFQYNENGNITGVKLIDLQTPRYSSPGIDLSFLICMNTSHSLRTERLNELIDIYKQSVLLTVGSKVSVPQFDISRTAIYGYIIASFFLPIMMADNVGIDEVLNQDPEHGLEIASKRGGQKETDALVCLIKDLLALNYIRKKY